MITFEEGNIRIDFYSKALHIMCIQDMLFIARNLTFLFGKGNFESHLLEMRESFLKSRYPEKLVDE